MSRRLAADMRLKMQNLQIGPGSSFHAAETRGSEVLRRRPEHRRRRGAEVGPEGYSRPPMPDSCSCFSQKRKDLVGAAEENVFINSYYPKLQGDFTEDCESSEKSISGCGEVLPNVHPSDSLGLGDSLESDSKTFRRKDATELHVDTSELLNVNVKDSERRTLHKSSRSRFTLDTRTYTLFSCASDVDSLRSDRRPIDQVGERKSSIAEKDVISAVDWFGQLHKRIEILEELLQQTLVTFPQKCREKARSKQEPKRKVKLDTETPRSKTGVQKAWKQAAGEDLDTDVELRNIKNRVRALEMKLKRKKPSHRFKPALEFQETARNSLVLPDIEKRCCCCCRGYQYANSDGNETSLPLQIVDLFESPRSEAEGEKLEKTVEEKRSKVKQNFIAKCKRIKGICSSVISFSGKSSRSNNHFVQISEEFDRVSYKQSIVTEQSLDETFRRQSLPTQFDPEKTENARVVYVECQPENPKRKRRKGNRRKRNELCRKTPITSFIMSRVGNWKGRGDVHLMQSEDVARSSSTEYEDVRWRVPGGNNPWRKFNSEYKPKAPKKLRSFRNPIDILRKGGRIKIPVLFREICKTSKTAEPVQKTSSISIRFVMVEKDSKHPMRKLVKKLSMGYSPERKEQYVFGVSKCSCDDETGKLSTMREGQHVKDFVYG